MASEPITIIIKKGKTSDTVGGGTGTPSTPSMSEDAVGTSQEAVSQQNGSTQSTLTSKAVGLALVNAGKQIGMNAINQYGNFTGNTTAQNGINAALQLGSMVAAIAVAPVLGSIAVAAQAAISVINSNIEITKQNNQSNLMLQRTGNASLNGGRGTNN